MPTHSSAYCACHTRCHAPPPHSPCQHSPLAFAERTLCSSCPCPWLSIECQPRFASTFCPCSTCLLTLFYAPLNAVNTSWPFSLPSSLSVPRFAVLFAIFKVINHKTARGYFIIITSGSEASFTAGRRRGGGGGGGGAQASTRFRFCSIEK